MLLIYLVSSLESRDVFFASSTFHLSHDFNHSANLRLNLNNKYNFLLIVVLILCVFIYVTRCTYFVQFYTLSLRC